MKRMCKTFGCPNFHHNRSGYCDQCTRRHARGFSDSADDRPSSQARGYDSRWREFSKRFLAEHPLCVICGDAAAVTDHRDTPAEIMLDLYGRFDLDTDHYQALCVSCNTRKGKDDRRKVDEYFAKKELRERTRGEGSKNAAPGATAPVRTINTHGEKHKGVCADGEET
jgi:5-methylcytosine-specific restriction protein A